MLQWIQTKPLRLPKYQWWFNTTISNDSKRIKETLSEADKVEKDKLNNNKFTSTKTIYKKFDNIDTSERSLFQIATPFCLAVVYAANDPILEFMDHGADVTVLDHSSNNCIHAMIMAAFIKPEAERKLRQTYLLLCENISPSMLEELLMQENDNGFWPLELAANLAIFGLFHDIFDTKDIYKTYQLYDGIYCKELYDVTEYECLLSGRRLSKSPMRLLAHLDQGSLNNNYIHEVFTSEHITTGLFANWERILLLQLSFFSANSLLS